MTNLTQYEKGCSPSAIQRKYGLTYEHGYELAERLKKIQELENENTKLKELLKQSRIYVLIDTEDYEVRIVSKSDREAAKKLLAQINQALGEE